MRSSEEAARPLNNIGESLSVDPDKLARVAGAVHHAERQSSLSRSDERQNGVRDHTGRLADPETATERRTGLSFSQIREHSELSAMSDKMRLLGDPRHIPM